MTKALIFLFMLISTEMLGQVIIWQNDIGGIEHEKINALEQTIDGNYILGGSSASGISGDKTEICWGFDDYWVIKLDTIGNIIWQNTIGGDNIDQMNSLNQTFDNGFILGGTSRSGISGDKTENSQGGFDYWIIKTDSIGNIQWQNTIGGSNDDRLYSIQQTMDGGYIIGGSSRSSISGDKTETSIGNGDYWLVKVDGLGNIVWQNTIGGNQEDILYSVKITNDGGYILGGTSKSGISGDKTEDNKGEEDYWIIKVDSLGSIEWQRTIGGNLADQFHEIALTYDGGYLLAGESLSDISGDKADPNIGGHDYWVIKLDSTGNIQWQKTIGGSSQDWLYCARQTPDLGYLLGGYSFSPISGNKTENSYGASDYWVVKTDSSGNIQWQKTLGGSTSDNLFSMDLTTNGNIILGGHSSSPISGIKNENSQGGYDYWVLKISDGLTSIIDNQQMNLDMQLYQYIEGSMLNIKITDKNNQALTVELYDNSGRLVKTIKDKIVYANSALVQVDIRNFTTGIYFVRVIGSGSITNRFIKL